MVQLLLGPALQSSTPVPASNAVWFCTPSITTVSVDVLDTLITTECILPSRSTAGNDTRCCTAEPGVV